jgi:hypothetical protein
LVSIRVDIGGYSRVSMRTPKGHQRGTRGGMNTDRWISLAETFAGIAVGCVIAFWQWHEAKKQGEKVYFFLHASRGWTELTADQKRQIGDMMAYLKPPKEKAAAQPPRKPS